MKILVTGACPLDAAMLRRLQELGMEPTLHPDERAPVVKPEQYEAVICNSLFLYHQIDEFTGLKLIQLTSAGLDRVPADSIRKRHIRLFSARGVYSIPMAEFALCGVLQLYKQATFFHRQQAAGCWQKHRGLRELSGKQVCIVGCGSVGTHCAQHFSACGCAVTGIDLLPIENAAYSRMLPLSSLDEILSISDILVMTLPLTEQTRHMLDGKQFSLMKKDAVLVNIARGAVVNTKAMRCWLQENPEAGAVLDVFETEPLPTEDSLWKMENVILTPHNSFIGENNPKRLFDLICENIQNWRTEESL